MWRSLEGVGLLREREFRLLFLGRTLSAVGDAIVPVAVTFAVLEIGDASDLGLVLGSVFAGRVAFLLVGGVWADRLPRQLVMIAADALRAAVQILIAVAFFTDSIAVWHLAVGGTLFGIASAFFNPASTGLIPQIVSRDQLQEANALLGLSRSLISVAGPAIGGLVVTTLGFGIVFAVDAATFIASLLCLVAMRLPRGVEKLARQTMWADMLDGLRVVRERQWMVVTLSTDFFFNVALAAYFVLGPVVVEDQLGGADAWGLVLAGSSLGGLLAGFLVLRFKPRRPLLLAYFVGFATPLELLILTPPLPLAAVIAGSALMFGAIVILNTLYATMQQQHVPPEALSRVDSFGWFTSLVGLPLAMVAVGPLSTAIGTPETLILAAVIAATANLTALSFRAVRDLPNLAHGNDAA